MGKTLANGESIKLMHGKVYKFSCDEGSIMEGNPTTYCDGNVWNGTKPECLSSPKNVFLEAEIDGLVVSSIETREDNSHADSITDLVLKPHTGQKITLSCLELGDVKLTNPVPEILFLKNGAPVTDSVSSSSNSITVIAKT